MKVLMHTTAASPEAVLHAGKVYNLPRSMAKSLLTPGPFGQPYASEAPAGAKAQHPPTRPDPEDVEHDVDVDDDLLEDDDDEE